MIVMTEFLKSTMFLLDKSDGTEMSKAPNFKPGMIGELCKSDSGAEKRIVFIETSGQNCLRPRQACSIESAARTNPDMTIYVYMALTPPPGSPEVDKGDGLERDCHTMDILAKFPNVEIIHEDLTQHFLDTPLEQILLDGTFDQSNFSFQHMADALRIVLLYKYGGIYIDMDVVILRSLACLRNTAGQVVSWGQSGLENGLLVFDKGHQLLNFYMRLMKQIYDPNIREIIGPVGFLKSVRMFCDFKTGNFDEYGEFFVCHNNYNITVMYIDAFYPIHFLDRTRFFANSFLLSDLDKFQTSYSVHVYDSGHGARVPETSLYAFLAQRFCPAIYDASSKLDIYNF